MAPSFDGSLVALARPTSAKRDRLLPVLGPLAPLFPGGGLQRGTVVAVDVAGGSYHHPELERSAGGATTLAFALLAAASATGSWCAGVGTPHPGVLSMADLGIDLHHLVLVPRPGAAWVEVTATLLDGMDVVLTLLPRSLRPATARRLAARARERQAVLVVLGRRTWWPQGPEVRLEPRDGVWHGLGRGHGYLRARRVEVLATGRGVAARPVGVALWLPGPSGGVLPA
ncbi:MAG TPA: hypothetical protein VMR97_00485 [Acidimicrobiales bacterium]|nr:hypothetical protein [Acidimicrobiales bacterium]